MYIYVVNQHTPSTGLGPNSGNDHLMEDYLYGRELLEKPILKNQHTNSSQ